MQAAAKLGISIRVTSVGSDSSDTGAPTMSPSDRAKEWQPAFSPDEDGLLHQLRAYLVQALDASTREPPFPDFSQFKCLYFFRIT